MAWLFLMGIEAAWHGGPELAASAGTEEVSTFQRIIRRVLYTISYCMSRKKWASHAGRAPGMEPQCGHSSRSNDREFLAQVVIVCRGGVTL
jgi:hypothetical protein